MEKGGGLAKGHKHINTGCGREVAAACGVCVRVYRQVCAAGAGRGCVCASGLQDSPRPKQDCFGCCCSVSLTMCQWVQANSL